MLMFVVSLFCLAGNTAVAESYQRIVVAGGSLTEIIYALGADDRLVAIDTTSLYPGEALEELPNVGYLRALSAEPILSLNPDLIIATDAAGPPQTLDQIRAAGVRVEIIPDQPSVDGIYAKIRHLADLLSLSSAGEQLIAEIEADFAEVNSILARIQERPRVLFLLSVGTGAPMAGGANTSADTMISLAGGTNVMRGMEDFKSVSPEAIVASAPEFVLIPQHSLERYGDEDSVFSLPELAATPAARDRNLIVFDSLYLTGFGPRTASAVLELAQRLHPNLDLARN